MSSGSWSATKPRTSSRNARSSALKVRSIDAPGSARRNRRAALTGPVFAGQRALSMAFAPRAAGDSSVVDEAALVEAPRGAVVQVEAAVGAEVLAGEELAHRARQQPHQLLVAQQLELLGRDGAAHAQAQLVGHASVIEGYSPCRRCDCGPWVRWLAWPTRLAHTPTRRSHGLLALAQSGRPA